MMPPPASLNQPVGRLRCNGGGEAKHQSRGELAESHCPPRLGQVAHLGFSGEDVARRKEVLTRKVYRVPREAMAGMIAPKEPLISGWAISAL